MKTQNLAARTLCDQPPSEADAGLEVAGNAAWEETLREETGFRLSGGEGEILKPDVRRA